jgi:hypothetical protein
VTIFLESLLITTKAVDKNSKRIHLENLAGNPAYILTGTYNDPRYGIRHIMDTGTILDDKGYFIQYLGTPIKYEQYLPIVQQMINSFEIARGVQEPVEEQDAMTTFEEEGGLLSNNSGVSNSLSEEASIHGDSLSSEQQHPIMVKKHSFTSTYPLSVECMVICKTFPIRYNISNGNLDSITYDESGSPSLFITSNNNLNSSDEYAKLTIEIPRTILDSRESNGNSDRDFMVLNAYSNREIYSDSYSRILEIVLYGPAQNPAIIGTTSSQSNPLASR